MCARAMGLLSWRALPGHLRTLSPPGRLQVSASTWLCHRALETPGAQHLLVEHKVASGPKFVPINSSPWPASHANMWAWPLPCVCLMDRAPEPWFSVLGTLIAQLPRVRKNAITTVAYFMANTTMLCMGQLSTPAEGHKGLDSLHDGSRVVLPGVRQQHLGEVIASQLPPPATPSAPPDHLQPCLQWGI